MDLLRVRLWLASKNNMMRNDVSRDERREESCVVTSNRYAGQLQREGTYLVYVLEKDANQAVKKVVLYVEGAFAFHFAPGEVEAKAPPCIAISNRHSQVSRTRAPPVDSRLAHGINLFC